jgi:CRP-like cAMP-binding protein
MSMDAVSAHLVRLEIFRGLKPLQITEIARHAERVVYKPGQLLIEDGKMGDAAIIVVGGDAVRIKAPMAPPEHEEPIEPGSLLGEMAMLIETDYSSTVVARTNVRALRITRDAMLAIMLEDPTLAEHLVAKVARRLHDIAAELRKIDVVLASTSDTPPPASRKDANAEPQVNGDAVALAAGHHAG